MKKKVKRFMIRTLCLVPVLVIILTAIILYWFTGKYVTGHLNFFNYNLLGN
jgi:hypothetical protein